MTLATAVHARPLSAVCLVPPPSLSGVAAGGLDTAVVIAELPTPVVPSNETPSGPARPGRRRPVHRRTAIIAHP